MDPQQETISNAWPGANNNQLTNKNTRKGSNDTKTKNNKKSIPEKEWEGAEESSNKINDHPPIVEKLHNCQETRQGTIRQRLFGTVSNIFM